MKAGELIKILSGVPPETPILIDVYDDNMKSIIARYFKVHYEEPYQWSVEYDRSKPPAVLILNCGFATEDDGALEPPPQDDPDED